MTVGIETEMTKDPVANLYHNHHPQMWRETVALCPTMQSNGFHLHGDLDENKEKTKIDFIFSTFN